MQRVALYLIGLLIALSLPSVGLSGARVPFLVVVDAGHGGHDPGARGFNGTLEKDLNLKIAKIVRLRSFAYPELTVVLTRSDDRFLELTERTAIANRRRADLYVSIHANAHSDARAEGIETLISERLTDAKRRQSAALAGSIQRVMIRQLTARDRGVKEQHLYLRHADMPSALVETGFLTNPEEERRLNRLSYQLKVADAIVAGILNYLNDL